MAQLPELLGEHDEGRGAPTRSPRLLEVAAVPDELAVELDQIVDVDALTALSDQDTATLESMTGRLVEFERWVSERRRTVQERLDQLQAEIVRRYRDGEASVDSLLA